MAKKVFFKVNQFITAPELRVIDEFGKQVGVISKHDALQKADELGVDLVEIAPLALPPVAKLINFAKFKYQQQQKNQEEKKKNKKSEIKEIRFTPFIAENDFQNRIKKAIDYLKDGDKVRLVVKFVGRQITRKDFGDVVLKKATVALAEYSKVEIEPKLIGKQIMMQVAPAKKKPVKPESTQQEETE